MLGGFVGRTLLLAFGYAYPAFRCFKTVEKNRVGIEELRFWCQYWIIMALVTVVERFADILISWLPFYSELKLALIVYLWHPKFSGTGNVYDNVLRPFVAKHENDIDRSLLEMRARAWDMTVLYWQYVAEMGQTVFLQALSYLSAHSQNLPQINTSQVMKKQDSMRRMSPRELSTPRSARFNRASPMKRSVSGIPGSDAADTTPNAQTTDFVYVEEQELEEAVHHMNNRPGPGHKSPPPTPIKVGASDEDKDNADDDFVDSNVAADNGKDFVDSNVAADNGKEDSCRPRQRSHISAIRQRRAAAV